MKEKIRASCDALEPGVIGGPSMVSLKKAGLAGDANDRPGRAPSWLGVVLVVASCFGSHFASATESPRKQASQPQSPVKAAVESMVRVGLIALPVLIALGVAGSVVRRLRRNRLHGRASSGAEAIAGMSWHEFELLVGEAFRRRGYQVVETGGAGPDGGVDLVLRKDGEKSYVQCKQWKAYKVGVKVVRELAGVMAVHGAVRGFVVTSGHFTLEAQAFARRSKVSLIDGAALAELIASTRRTQPAPAMADRIEPTFESTAGAATPACPVCASAMVRRVAKRGANEGKAFWGCPSFPACKGTRMIG